MKWFRTSLENKPAGALAGALGSGVYVVPRKTREVIV